MVEEKKSLNNKRTIGTRHPSKSWFIIWVETWWAVSVKQVLACRLTILNHMLFFFYQESDNRCVMHVFQTISQIWRFLSLCLQSCSARRRNWTLTTRIRMGECCVCLSHCHVFWFLCACHDDTWLNFDPWYEKPRRCESIPKPEGGA